MCVYTCMLYAYKPVYVYICIWVCTYFDSCVTSTYLLYVHKYNMYFYKYSPRIRLPDLNHGSVNY